MNDVSILVIGDPHFKISGITEHERMCEAVIKIAKDKNPDVIVILGDMLDRFETIHVSPLTRSVNFLIELVKIAPIYLLIGNHDLKNNKQFLSQEHGFTTFNILHELQLENIDKILQFTNDILPNNIDFRLIEDEVIKIIKSKRIKVVDKVITDKINGHKFVFLPYVPPGKFQKALNKNDIENATCIFAHQEFKGAQMGAIKSTEGDEWPIENPFVISGHVHDYQYLQENILYVGTPIQHTFGDNPNKTISLFNFSSPSLRSEERINLGLPRKATVKISQDEVDKYIPPTNSLLKITIVGNNESLKTVMNHPNVIKWKELGHKIATKPVPLSKDETNTEIFLSAPPKFSTAFENRINGNSQLQELYYDLFGIQPKSLKLKIFP